jgi:hypothetical protein
MEIREKVNVRHGMEDYVSASRPAVNCRDFETPNLPQSIFTTNPTRQNATAAMPCASTANNGGVWRV